MSLSTCKSCGARHSDAERVQRVMGLFLTEDQAGDIDAEILGQLGEPGFDGEELCARCLVSWMADAASNVR